MGNNRAMDIESKKPVTERSPVKSALRTLTLFEAFARSQKPLSLSELSRALNIPMSSCHGLVTTLRREGYLYALGDRKQFYPTRRLLELSNAIFQHDPLLEILTPHLSALRDKSGETVILGMRQGDEVVYLDVIEGTQTIRYSAGAGESKPLHSSSIGKAMLGELGDADLRRLIASLTLDKVTSRTLVKPDELINDIQRAKEQGYFLTRGENVSDVWAIAQTVHIVGEIFAIAIAGPIYRMEEYLEIHKISIADCCKAIEAEFEIL